jgi:hypothetical protein
MCGGVQKIKKKLIKKLPFLQKKKTKKPQSIQIYDKKYYIKKNKQLP